MEMTPEAMVSLFCRTHGVELTELQKEKLAALMNLCFDVGYEKGQKEKKE